MLYLGDLHLQLTENEGYHSHCKYYYLRCLSTELIEPSQSNNSKDEEKSQRLHSFTLAPTMRIKCHVAHMKMNSLLYILTIIFFPYVGT